MATFARPKVLYPGRFLAVPIFHIVVIYNVAEFKSFVYIQYYVNQTYRVGYVSFGALQTSDQNKYTLCKYTLPKQIAVPFLGMKSPTHSTS